MAQCVQSVQEFIQDSFVPMVAVLSSQEAETVSRKNNLNFAELLRPFCRLTSEGLIRDPNNQLQTVKNLRICVNNLVTSPIPTSGSMSPAQYRMLNEVVLSFQPQEGAQATVIKTGDYSLNLSVTTPWFEAYRDHFLQSMPALDHEFLNHYLACLLVVSSTETVPLEQFLKLSQEQHRIQHSGEYTHPKWFIPNTLKYYILLHDMSEGDEQRAETVYEDMKQRYGPHGCYLLKINSRTTSAEQDEQIPDPWSQYLLRSNQRNQEVLDLAPAANSAAVENSVCASDVDSTEKDGSGESSNLETHPLQLDTDTSSASLQALSDVNTELKKGSRDTDILTPGNYGACLTLNDHDHIRQFVQEFTFRGLLPHVEKNIRQLNDQLISRKGLSRSLFTATKKWFGGGKGPEKSVSEPKSTYGLLYPPEAPELQIRKMADLCFLVQHYELAYSCYHTAKKDFLSDQAMLYAAGALEMAAVSAFLQGGAPRPYPAHYMETAIQTYRDVCRNMVLAERCALLSAEILKSQGKYSEAASLLIKMTSEDSDLRSALLLEQAAHCFINMRNPMVRKFAFHMILAGHRFSKAGQRRHALRCYCQAMQVYKERGWSLAEDHINFTIGRHSFTLSQPENAVMAFRQILVNDSRQTATQQAAFLREFLYVYKSVVGENEGHLPELPLPYIHSSATRVFFGHERRLADGEKQAATHVSLDQEYDQSSSAMWCNLEEQLVASANRGIVPNTFQPSQSCLNSQTDNLRHPLAVVEEPIIVELTFRNPLKVSLTLSNLSLLWKFTADGTISKDKTSELITGESISNEEASALQMAQKDDIATTEIIKEFHIGLEETKMARLRLLPHRTGQLNIVGVVYDLTSSSVGETTSDTEGQQTLNLITVRGRQDLKIQGPRLNQTKEDKMQVRHSTDRRLDPIITPPMPLMEVFFLQFPTALLCGEIRKAYVEFCNVSAVPLCGLRVVSTHPDFFTFGSQASTPPTPVSAENCSAYKTFATNLQLGSEASEVLVSAEEFGQPLGVIEVPVQGGVLQPGASVQLPLWLRGSDKEGVHEINFLFYYESSEKTLKISHRVLRHTVFICASRSLSIQASACRSTAPPLHSVDDKSSRGTLVFIDVENVNTSEGGVREFHIVQVSSGSQHWRLHKYINPSKDDDCKLSSRERTKLCFRATRCKPHQANLDTIKKFTFADLNLGNERIISSYTPCGDFFFRCCSTSAFQPVDSSSRTPNSKSQNSGPTEISAGSDVTRIAQKCNELDLNLIVIWKAYVIEDNRQLILEGQLHVALQTFGKETSSLVPKEEAQEMVLLKFKSDLPPPVILPFPELSQLIKTNLHYPETFTHHFVQDSLCLVPVTLTLSNCSLALIDVIIDLRHKNTSLESLEVHSSFAWVGQSQYKLQLGQQEVVSLALKACFFRAGVYNLNTPRVFAKPAEQSSISETSQQTSSPALIIIKST
ncbi:trafficking protein particle complex subunit 8 [Austrofundulus limnaeus]|uniref:Trafficking protein particle complex subunit 8 n=1 Tax=Austrofundulus limnaeus TaxID=52670 RepID=A0A2I4BYS0_AUSLI|nr:PREDICTED: trafficking protein particle complex subunit 8 [Austrofundulus limnaeus]